MHDDGPDVLIRLGVPFFERLMVSCGGVCPTVRRNRARLYTYHHSPPLPDTKNSPNLHGVEEHGGWLRRPDAVDRLGGGRDTLQDLAGVRCHCECVCADVWIIDQMGGVKVSRFLTLSSKRRLSSPHTFTKPHTYTH